MNIPRWFPKLTSSRPGPKYPVHEQEVGTNAERQHDDQATGSR